jgi:hypothetical protein
VTRPDRRRGRRVRRVAGIFLLVVVTLVTLAASAVLVVFYVPAASRAVLGRTISWYADQIPGTVATMQIRGALARETRIHDVRLEDALGRPVVAARTLRVRLRPGPLLLGRVRLDLELEDAVVHVWPERGLRDLVPERSEPDRDEPDPEIGPDIPVRVGVTAELRGVDVIRHDPDGTRTALVRDLQVRADARARGREASVTLDHASGRLANDVGLVRLHAEARWSSPRLEVDPLVVVTNDGRVDLQATLNVETEAVAVDLRATADPHALSDAPEDFALLHGVDAIELAARVRGTPRSLRMSIDARAGERLRARATGLASLSPRIATVLDWQIALAPPDVEDLRMRGVTAARQRRDGFEASGFVECTSCPEPVVVGAHGAMLDDRWWARAEARVPRMALDARARGTTDQLERLQVEADVQELAPLRRALAPWLDLPEVEARLTARARCFGDRLDRCRFAADARALVTPVVDASRVTTEGTVRRVAGLRVIDVRLDAEGLRRDDVTIGDLEIEIGGTHEALEIAAALDGPPGTRAVVDMRVEPSATTRIDLRDLAIAHRGMLSRLVDPARIEVSAEEIEIDALRLRVGTGLVEAAGRLATRARTDFRLVLRDIVLSELDPLLPGPRVEGVLSATLGLRGTLEEPEASFDLHARGLVVDRVELGTVQARLALRDELLAGRLSARGGLARRAEVDVSIPFASDLASGLAEASVSIPDHRPLRINASVERLALERLPTGVVPPRSSGTVDARLDVEGPMRAPIVSGRVDGRDLALQGGLIGDATALVSFEDERAALRLRLEGPWARRLRAEASIPMTVHLGRREIDLHEHRELRLAVHGEGLNLSVPRTWVGNWPASGTADVTLGAEGSVVDWRAHAFARARELAYEGHAVGDALVDVEVTTDHGDLDLRVTGPAVRRLHVRARAPLRTDEGRLPAWNPHGMHNVDVLLQGLNVERLGVLTPELPVSGLVEGVVHLEGSVDDASGVVDLVTRRLAWRDHRLGRVWVAARYDGERLVALAEQQSGLGEWIRARLEAPVSLVDRAPWVEWRSMDAHAFDLHAAGIDEQLLGAFVELPAETTLDASARLQGTGNRDDFHIDGQIRGRVGREAAMGTTFSADLEIGPHEQELRAVLGGAGVETANIVTRTEAPVVDLARGDLVLDDVPFELELRADRLRLTAFDPLLPTTLDGLDGVLQARAFGSGTVGNPDIRGFVEIHDGAVTVVPMLQRFEGADVFVVFDGSRIRLEELNVRSGRGRTSARGQLLIGRGALRGHLVARTRALPLVRPGLPIMTLDTRVVATVDTRPEPTRVSVTAENTRLRVMATTVDAPTSIPTSDDIVFVDRRPRQRPVRPEDPPPPEVPSDLHLTLRLGTPALVIGPNADMEWDGAVEVTRIAGETRATGALEATRGRFLLLGREFDLERGIVTLPEERTIDPFIDLVATTALPDGSVTVTLRGRASRPDLRLTSSPPLPETEVFSLLVTGAPGGARDESTEFDAQAAAMLAAFNNPVIAGHLRETIGIDRVGVAFGEDIENPILTVGKRLNRRLYLETRYHHDAPVDQNTAEVRLEYAFIPPRWSLQTHFGDAAVGGIEIWWQRRFGG